MANRIAQALQRKNGGNQSEMARFIGVSPQAVQKWIAGDSEPKGKNLQKASEFLGVSPAFLRFGESVRPGGAVALGTQQGNIPLPVPRRRAADFELVPADETHIEVGSIEYWDAKGSCGGGFLNFEQAPKGHLVKESTFFSKYGLKPSNAFAIYADGNSMADFIVDGDIVIFDRSKTEPKSGRIFAIDHPEGLRIKILRRAIDGAWILESKNPDKRTYPDERIPPDQLELLKILGEFVYRQGG